jgi:hypothetical protein
MEPTVGLVTGGHHIEAGFMVEGCSNAWNNAGDSNKELETIANSGKN